MHEPRDNSPTRRERDIAMVWIWIHVAIVVALVVLWSLGYRN